MLTKMKVLGLSILAFSTMGLSSCPSNDEPDTFVCSMGAEQTASCVNTLDNAKRFKIKFEDMIGYQCVDAHGFGDIKSHHQILHKELSDCGGN